ncbi:MAG: family transcriptional regulator, cyclic receptor protein [Frankiaceae bacterium]|nr:family transcriptional regulator, cyclic receptor protein [Frankiaceae bacterium]
MARPARPRLPRTSLDIAELLGTVPLFASLTLQQRDLLARTTRPRKVRRGELVVAQGAPGDALFIVARGSVLVHRTGRGGERRAMTVIEAPGSFGEIPLVDGGRRSASVEALEDTDLFVVPRSEFLRLLVEEPKMVQGVLRELGRMVRRLTDQLTDASLLDLPGRVAKTLVRLVEVRREGNPEALPVVGLSQSKLAELAGGSRQSVNGALASLASRGLIQIDGRRIVVIDLPGLRARAGRAPVAAARAVR